MHFPAFPSAKTAPLNRHNPGHTPSCILLTLTAWMACAFSITAAPQWKEFYDPMTVRSLHLAVDPADWTRVINDQPAEGETLSQERATAWFSDQPITVAYTAGVTPAPGSLLVEIRRKGATDPVLTSGGLTKASLKIDFNELVAGQKWNDLRKLSLEIGNASGPLNEGFAWQVHRLAAEAGFYHYDAANAAWAKLYVNGAYHGVFTSTEQRDEQMLRNRDLYSEANTWLYKVDGSTFIEEGTGNSPTFAHLDFPPFAGKSGGGGSTPDLAIDLPQWIDMESMLTLGACNAYLENNDGLFKQSGKNSFAADFRPPNERLRLYFPWDLDASIKQGSENIYGNFYKNAIVDNPWFKRVYEHTLREMIAGPLSEDSLHALLDELEVTLGPELAGDPFIGAGSGSFSSLRSWVTIRNANVRAQLTLPFVARPAFSQNGGEVISGFGLTMAAPAGQIYYTTDGSDPRAPGGAVGAAAQLYSGPLMIDLTTTGIARALSGGNWSGLATKATFNVADYATAMRVTEIMYNPVGGDAYEFIELRNTGTTALDLSGFHFDGISYTFPAGTDIPAGGYVVLVRDPAVFATRHPGVTPDGIYLGGLNNGGEKIRLRNADGTTVISVEYDDDPPWVLSPDGLGYSLVNRNPEGSPDLAANWRASRDVHGSPGSPDPEPGHALDVVVNEVLANSSSPYEDAVELHNTATSQADVGGWFLSDQARDATGTLVPALLKKFVIPTGTVIPANGFAAFYQQQFDQANPLVPFVISPYGGRIYLSSADGSGNLTGVIIALDFPATLPNVAFGRIATSTGHDTARLAVPTFGANAPADIATFRTGTGAPNAAALVGPMVISEIMYNPLESGSEFVELQNISDAAVDISGWDIDGIAGFSFPAGTIIPAGGFVLLVDTAKTTPEAFRSGNGVPAAVPVFGGLFDLGNAGEALRLDQPNPDPLQPDILVERVRFNDKAPWPTEADGVGPSLERFAPSAFGNDPVHWRAAAFNGSPGRPGSFTSGIAIAGGSFWDHKASASSPGTVWRNPGYNASAWSAVNGPAGYGEPFIAGPVSFGPDPAAKYPTTYFRKSFVLADDPAAISSLNLSMLYDDGVVVYLNGTEIVRRGMPDGIITYETLATVDREAVADEEIDITAFKHLLLPGTNLLAVEVHQSDPASADLVWNGDLTYTLAVNTNDEDNDGLPRDWEIANGLNDNDPADALLDTDGDGRNNSVEFLAGTDPRNPSSFFKVESAERTSDGVVVLRWISVPGKTYRVSYSGDLLQWFSFGSQGDLTATDTVTEFSDPSATLPAHRFYRIEVVP